MPPLKSRYHRKLNQTKIKTGWITTRLLSLPSGNHPFWIFSQVTSLGISCLTLQATLDPTPDRDREHWLNLIPLKLCSLPPYCNVVLTYHGYEHHVKYANAAGCFAHEKGANNVAPFTTSVDYFC